MEPSSESGPNERAFEHLKPRYSFRRVVSIFGISETTLRRWIRDGKIVAIYVGPRNIQFEREEVERVYRRCRRRSVPPKVSEEVVED